MVDDEEGGGGKAISRSTVRLFVAKMRESVYTGCVCRDVCESVYVCVCVCVCVRTAQEEKSLAGGDGVTSISIAMCACIRRQLVAVLQSCNIPATYSYTLAAHPTLRASH